MSELKPPPPAYPIQNVTKKAIIKEVESYNRCAKIEDAQPLPTGDFKQRSLLGIHTQPQEGKVRVVALVPSSSISFKEARVIAEVADNYSLEFFNISKQ